MCVRYFGRVESRKSIHLQYPKFTWLQKRGLETGWGGVGVGKEKVANVKVKITNWKEKISTTHKKTTLASLS